MRTTSLKILCGGFQGRYRGITLTLYTAKRLGLIVLPHFTFIRIMEPCQQDYFFFIMLISLDWREGAPLKSLHEQLQAQFCRSHCGHALGDLFRNAVICRSHLCKWRQADRQRVCRYLQGNRVSFQKIRQGRRQRLQAGRQGNRKGIQTDGQRYRPRLFREELREMLLSLHAALRLRREVPRGSHHRSCPPC